jgi:hypothetical protein
VHQALLAECGVAGHRNGEDCRLANIRLRQSFCRTFKANRLQIEAEHFVGLVKESHDFGIILSEVLTHSRELGTLTCKKAIQHNTCPFSETVA